MNADWLRGKQVAITGRLASLSRAEAAALIEAHGGQVAPAVGDDTAVVIVGPHPLNRHGSLTTALRHVQRLTEQGQAIALVPEHEFLQRLGLGSRVHGLYTATQASQILRIAPGRVQAWLRAGLVQARDRVHGVCFFDYQQLAWAKTLYQLTRAGVRVEQIQRSLEQLKHWLPEVEQPLAQLGLLADGGRLLVRLESGQLADPTGQAHLDFGDDAHRPTLLTTTPADADEWFELGCTCEHEGRLTEAADAYRHALELSGPDADICFNLANVLCHLDQPGPAAELYRQALELDPTFASAWNNLGNVLITLNEPAEAVRAYRQALELNPHDAETHYNLADTLDELGQRRAARPHWQAYLRQATDRASAQYARSRLRASEDAQPDRRQR